MKKLGLIGGTGPESTVIYYKEITSRVQRATGNFPRMAIESLSVYDVLRFCGARDYDGLAEYLLSGLRALAGAGCDFAALTGITPHIVLDRVAGLSPIPVVSMVDTSVQYARAHGFRRLALLGTAPTMENDFFRAPFRAEGLETVVPDAQERAFIHSRIADELELGLLTEETAAGMRGIAERLIREEGAEAIILGCTELPLVFEKMDLPVPKMDVMRIHIGALCGMITEEEDRKQPGI